MLKRNDIEKLAFEIGIKNKRSDLAALKGIDAGIELMRRRETLMVEALKHLSTCPEPFVVGHNNGEYIMLGRYCKEILETLGIGND